MKVEGLHVARHLRPLPGSQRFDTSNPLVLVGTRFGIVRSRARPGALVAPVDADPRTFKWPVQDLHVMVINDGGPEQVGFDVGAAILEQGAKLVVIANRIGDNLVSHRTLYSDTFHRGTADDPIPLF